MHRNKRVKCGRLPNGVRFYSQYDSGSSKELVIVAVMVGSFNDPPHKRGLAHLTEHVVCVETKTRNAEEVDLLFARTCGEPDFGTWNIETDGTSTIYGSS